MNAIFAIWRNPAVKFSGILEGNPDSKIHGVNMGPTWVLSASDGPHVGPMNLAIMEYCIELCAKLQRLTEKCQRINEIMWVNE